MQSNELGVVARIQELLDRAAADPDLETALVQDPWGVAEAEGITRDETKKALALHPLASDREISEALNQRVSHSIGGPISIDGGGGGGGGHVWNEVP